MTDGLRYAALRLGALAPADSDWILRRLPVKEADALRALMRQPAVAKLAAYAAAVDAPKAVPVSSLDAMTPRREEPDFDHLDDEDPTWIAAWLRMQGQTTESQYLSAVSPARQRQVARALDEAADTLPPRLREWLVQWQGSRGDAS